MPADLRQEPSASPKEILAAYQPMAAARLAVNHPLGTASATVVLGFVLQFILNLTSGTISFYNPKGVNFPFLASPIEVLNLLLLTLLGHFSGEAAGGDHRPARGAAPAQARDQPATDLGECRARRRATGRAPLFPPRRRCWRNANAIIVISAW